MIKKMSTVAVLTVIILALVAAGFAALLAPVSAKSAALYVQPTPIPVICQCVKLVTNELFGIDNIVTSVGPWGQAKNLAVQSYWNDAYNQKLSYKRYGLGLYTQVLNPVAPRANDVIIMRQDALVYVKMTNGAWDKLIYIGGGSGHIGFVTSAAYYDRNFSMTSPKLSGLSGWLITMRSSNWGTKYNFDKDAYGNIISAWTDVSAYNPYSVNGGFYKQNGCNNVTDSIIFLPTGNPVSFWRLK